MPTPEDKVELAIAGRVHDEWESYEIDSDLLTPADAWRVDLGPSRGGVPDEVVPGATVEVLVGGERVMTGRIDEIVHRVQRGGQQLSLTGRDGAAVLLDCSAPIFVAQQADLPEVVAKVVRPLGITRVRIDADETRTLEKVNVEPGETAWSALAHAAEANGLWPWFDPDGTLVVGGPDYTTAPVGTLVLWGATNDGNVLNLTYTRSMHRRYSELTVLGQTQGTLTETAKHALKATATDTGVGYYRPRLVVDHEADDALLCQTRARKLIADARLASVDLSATVRGHRIAGGGQPGAGRLWQPGQRVNVRSEPHGIDAVFFVMGRRFFGGRDQSPTTQLTLKEDGLWVLDAHPRKRVYRRGKNLSAGGIEDVTVDSSLEAP